MSKNNFDGLQIAKKVFAGVEIGFVVGWWFYKRGWKWSYQEDGEKSNVEMGFRSIRNGLIFPTLKAASDWRNAIEKTRKVSVLEFQEVE